MKQTIDNLLALREYAVKNNLKCAIYLHQEDSTFVRLANSGISLITSEKLSRLSVECFEDKKVASAEKILDTNDLDSMKALVDSVSSMLPYASELTYVPSFPVFQEISIEEEGYDERLHNLSNDSILKYIQTAAEGLENDDLMLSGNFTKGETRLFSLSTENSNYAFWRNSDAQITLVLSSIANKWEINAEQSANRLEDLNPKKLRKQLQLLKSFYEKQDGEQVPKGNYTLVLGPAAIAEYLGFLSYCGSFGSSLKMGTSIFKQDDVGKEVLSPLFTLWEDPSCHAAFAQKVDAYGIKRKPFTLYENGVHKGFLWSMQAADEYAETSSGIDVNNPSFVIKGGESNIDSLEELLKMPRDCDILYVPYLHYTGLVNPTEGLVTGTTRFGALWLKKDGSVACPFNVRITEKVADIFGKKLVWLSKNTEAYNTSASYGRRTPDASMVPSLMMIKDVHLELCNSSY